MLLLITDTSGRQGSVALVRADESRESLDAIEEVPLTGGAFSAQLVPQIATLLAKSGLSKTNIGAFVVVSGPGSFTGLRVGLAAIKALGEILQKPIVPVSLLEVVALAGRAEGKVFAALDAGRDEVYAGEYEVADGNARIVREQLLTKDEFASAVGSGVALTPDEKLAGSLRAAGISVSSVASIRTEMIARVGFRKLLRGESVSPAQLEANYIRRDAEIFAKPST